ncbi:hypothetical protein KAT36_03335 [Candidatus Pacearchaeota archaeon]|nr:hypothetical protein [Candidatus Pacearchaeota archaeon]
MKSVKKFIKKNKTLENIFRIPYGIFKRIKFTILTFWVKAIGISNSKKHLKLLDNKQSNELIKEMINSNKPFMIARYGGTEFSVINNLGDRDYEFDYLHTACGFFPKDKSLIDKFKKINFESSKHLDILAIWLYKYHFRAKVRLIKKYPNIKNFIGLEVLDPHKNEWIKSLEGKRVLVIHPFKKSIEYQYKRRKNIDIIPEFKHIEILKAVQSSRLNKTDFKDWFEALEYMKKEINKKKDKFDIAIIGCGAYGFPLAAYTKKLGKQAIHMGGSLQLLFGIKGKRWEKEKFPKTWITPLREDTPNMIKKVKNIEGSCYW